MAEKLAVLNEKAGRINTVVTTINKVADQTNLLSLNAAIEAEKAGEYGLGFAVVAREIRRLADQTAVATYDIERMVKEMESAVNAGRDGHGTLLRRVRQGVADVREVGGELTQIIEQVQALAPRFEAVNEGMQSQPPPPSRSANRSPSSARRRSRPPNPWSNPTASLASSASPRAASTTAWPASRSRPLRCPPTLNSPAIRNAAQHRNP